MDYTEKVVKQSNAWYNDGLKRANIHDLTGAISSLQRSLMYCGQNIAARNLLGLVYFGRGEVNEALVQWIISKNLRPRDNIANYFIKDVETSSAELNKININIKKYNQCLTYCKQDAEDLALIQIKKVAISHPTYVKAHQLEGYLLIRKGHYTRARQSFKKALRLDTTDPITLYYLRELTATNFRNKKELESKTIGASYGAEHASLIQPTADILEEHRSKLSIISTIIGAVIGIAVMAFLIEPALLERESLLNADVIRAYSQEIDTQDAQISALETELESYRTLIDEAQLAINQQDDTLEGYELLYAILNQLELDLAAYEEQVADSADGSTDESTDGSTDVTDSEDGDSSSSSEIELEHGEEMRADLIKVNLLVLGEEGLRLYESLVEQLFVPRCEKLYGQALEAIEAENYEAVIIALEEVMTMIESYESYQAMYLLAQAYEEEEDVENASAYLTIITSECEDLELVDQAKALMEIIDDKPVTAEE